MRRRDLKVGIKGVELKLCRRTRTSADSRFSPPHFVYTISCSWSGETIPRNPHAESLSSPRPTSSQSPRSPRSLRSEDLDGELGKTIGGFGGPCEWWKTLPQKYTIKRKWQDIVRLHASLKHELAYDPILNCRRIKGKVPKLPEPADVDTWLQSYASTGDACAHLRSPIEISSKDTFKGYDELGDLHWMYCNNRLAPFFQEVNKVLEEVPTEILACSLALRKFVAQGVTGRRPRSTLPIHSPFLGALLPVMPEKSDFARAAAAMIRSRSQGALTDSKRPAALGKS